MVFLILTLFFMLGALGALGAAAVIQKRWLRLPRSTCPKCRYDLAAILISRGLAVQCPECGKISNATELRRPKRSRAALSVSVVLGIFAIVSALLGLKDRSALPYLPTRAILWILQTHWSSPNEPWTSLALDELKCRVLSNRELEELMKYALSSLSASSQIKAQKLAVEILTSWTAIHESEVREVFEPTSDRFWTGHLAFDIALDPQDGALHSLAVQIINYGLQSNNPETQSYAARSVSILGSMKWVNQTTVLQRIGDPVFALDIMEALVALGDEGQLELLSRYEEFNDDYQARIIFLLDAWAERKPVHNRVWRALKDLEVVNQSEAARVKIDNLVRRWSARTGRD